MLYKVERYVIDALRLLKRYQTFVVALGSEKAVVVCWHSGNNVSYGSNVNYTKWRSNRLQMYKKNLYGAAATPHFFH